MYIDIHSHVIPGIDDGAKDMETSMQMLRIAAEQGTSHIIATPHYFPGITQYDVSTIVNHCSILNDLTAAAGMKIKILPGSEVFLTPDVPERCVASEICTLNQSSHMLIELPFTSYPLYMDDVLYKLQLEGITPIIAHPERNANIFLHHTQVDEYVNRGILIQVNSGSITGLFGKTVQKAAMQLIQKGLVHFVASDAHTCGGRSPNLTKAAMIVEEHFGRSTADKLFYENATRFIF